MEIATIIQEHWNDKQGLDLRVRKGTLQRDLNIPPWNRWDVWGYAIRPGARTGQYTLLLRGDARPDRDSQSFIMERGRKVKGVSIADYLKGFDLVSINGQEL